MALSGLLIFGASSVVSAGEVKIGKIMDVKCFYAIMGINKSIIWEDDVPKALTIADKVTDQDCLFSVAMTLASNGNPSRAVEYASKLTDYDKQFKVAQAVVHNGNPANGRKILEKLPPEYIPEGYDLLYSTGNLQNAHDFINKRKEDYIKFKQKID